MILEKEFGLMHGYVSNTVKDRDKGAIYSADWKSHSILFDI